MLAEVNSMFNLCEIPRNIFFLFKIFSPFRLGPRPIASSIHNRSNIPLMLERNKPAITHVQRQAVWLGEEYCDMYF